MADENAPLATYTCDVTLNYAKAYQFFVLDYFLRMKDHFPATHHSRLHHRLESIHCPHQWVNLPQSYKDYYLSYEDQARISAQEGVILLVELRKNEMSLLRDQELPGLFNASAEIQLEVLGEWKGHFEAPSLSPGP